MDGLLKKEWFIYDEGMNFFSRSDDRWVYFDERLIDKSILTEGWRIKLRVCHGYGMEGLGISLF